jgi:signal transduction histidine kinase
VAGGSQSGGGRSLRTTFLLVALAILLPFLGLVAYFGYSQIVREKGRLQDEALSRARTVAAQVDAHLTLRFDALGPLGEAVAANAGNPAAIEAALRRYRQSYPDFDQVVVVDQVGAVAATAVPETRRQAFGDQEWFRRAVTATQPFVGEPRAAGPDVVVGFYTAARTPEGQLRGVVAADLNLKRVQDLLARARLTSGSVAQVVNERGIVVARQPALYLMQDVQGLVGYADLLRRQEAVGEVVFEDGDRRLAGAVPIRPPGWTTAVGLPSARVLAETRSLLIQFAGGAAVITVLSLAFVVSLGRRTTRGMERLRAAMRRLEAGDIPTGVPVTVGGEVGALTEGFNRAVAWLRNKVNEFEALSRVEEAAGAAIVRDRTGSGATLPDLLRRVVAGMGADLGALLTQEEEGLVTRAAVGLPGLHAEGTTLHRGQGLAGAVVGSREAIVIADAEADYRIEEPFLKAAGVKSAVGVPIVSGDAVLGAVLVGYRASHTFTDPEVQRLEAMARRTAQAIEQDRAFEEVRRNTAGLEAKLAEQMAALQKASAEQAEARRQAQEARRQTQELEQTIRMQVSQVKEVVRADPAAEEAKRVRAAMQQTVSEELRVPLTALLDLPRFLVDGLDKPLGHEERQQLEILHARGEEIIELIDNLVILSGLHGDQLKVVKAPFSMPELVQRVARGLQPRAAAKGNRIQTDVKPGVGQVTSAARQVEEILTNLVATSVKYTELGEIRVTCYQQGTDVVLAVADDGAGFTPEEQAKIFEPFLQIVPRGGRKLPGTGLQLTVCQRLVKLLGGRIKVESEPDRGTWFTVTLPIHS